MAAKFTMTKTIAARPEKVFTVFTDLDRAAERIRGIKKLELLSSGPVGKGTRFRETRVMFGKEATEEMEITDFQPGRSYSVGGESCGARFLTRFDFRSENAGTVVQMEFSATPVSFFAKVMSAFAGLMMGPMKKAMEKDLDDLKAAAEKTA